MSSQGDGIAELPPPPFWAVIFTSERGESDPSYDAMASRMTALAASQPGFLGVESVRGADGIGITVSYWRSLQDIARWRQHAEHQVARQLGRERWYRRFAVRVARVER